MPYKPTGRPPGRPRKHPVKLSAADIAAVDAAVLVELRKGPAKTLSRARRAFRAMAERLAPTQAVQRFGKRPRRRASSQSRFA